MFPIRPMTKPMEISRVVSNWVILKSSRVSRKLMKKTVLTIKGMINCAPRYLCSKSFINRRYPKFTFHSRNGRIPRLRKEPPC